MSSICPSSRVDSDSRFCTLTMAFCVVCIRPHHDHATAILQWHVQHFPSFTDAKDFPGVLEGLRWLTAFLHHDFHLSLGITYSTL